MAGLGEPQVAANAGLMTENRRFPPPWTVEETDACFIVRDHNGQALSPSISRKSLGGDRPQSC